MFHEYDIINLSNFNTKVITCQKFIHFCNAVFTITRLCNIRQSVSTPRERCRHASIIHLCKTFTKIFLKAAFLRDSISFSLRTNTYHCLSACGSQQAALSKRLRESLTLYATQPMHHILYINYFVRPLNSATHCYILPSRNTILADLATIYCQI